MSDRLLYVLAAHNALLQKKGAEFERFFTKAAILMWGDDFHPWKPQGPYGDFKCDGYRTSEQCVFQCNAPERFVARDVEGKIEEDFEGARLHFEDKMKLWIFVHNQKETPAKAGNRVLQLGEKYPNLQLKIWTFDHFLNEILELPDAALDNLLFEYIGGHELTPDLKNRLLKALQTEVESEPPLTPQAEQEPLAQPNRSAFDEIMEELSNEDREVRRRLLGYSWWLNPATKGEIKDRIVTLGFSEELVSVNALRLQEAGLIKITENHYLAIEGDVTQFAANTVINEVISELEA